MSQGLIANLLVSSFIILLITGWFQSILDTFKLRKYLVVVLLLSYLFLANIWIQIPNTNITMNFGGTFVPFLLLVWIYIVFFRTQEIGESICASMLSASLLLLVHEVLPNDPKLFIIDHFITYPLLLTVTTIIIIKNPLHDTSSAMRKAVSSIILSVLILDISSVFYIPKHYYGYIGDGYANDLLFLTMLFVISTYKVLEISITRKWVLFRKNTAIK